MVKDTLRAVGVNRRAWLAAVSGGAMLFVGMLACAQSPPGAPQVPAAPVGAAALPSQPAQAEGLAHFREGTYYGKVGARLVQVQLVLDRSAEDSVTGSYFFFGEGANILLVGEFDGNQLHLEESRNGIDVSGTWDATLDADHILGTWSDAEETVRLDFDLKRIGPATKT